MLFTFVRATNSATHSRRALLTLLALLSLLVPAWGPRALAAAPGTAYAPQRLIDNIQTIESTKLDVGEHEPNRIFDLDPTTCIRTPAINPMFVRVQFKTPVTCEQMRLSFTEDVHVYTIAIADTLDDLRGKTGTYKVLADKRETPDGKVALTFDTPLAIKCVSLDVQRKTGDDYVHVFEWMFCRPGKVESWKLVRVTDRRNPDSEKGSAPVAAPLDVPTDTVLVFKAQAQVGGVKLDILPDLAWTPSDAGVAPFMGKAGEFLVSQPGAHTLTATYGPDKQVIEINATARPCENRKPDVEVLYIERLPRLAFDDPNGGLPKPGQEIIWRGHLYNWGEQPVKVDYAWRHGDVVVESGDVVIPVGPPGVADTPVDFKCAWSPHREDLSLTISPIETLDEVSVLNNKLTIQTDALAVGLWVERSLWDFNHEHQMELGLGDANSFAGWGQRLIRQWNKMFQEAVYREYPHGITERVRLDRLVIVPDFSLPLHGGIPSNSPDLLDKTIDIQWGMEAGDLRPGIQLKLDHWWSPEKAINALKAGRVAQEDPPFWCGFGYIHEMGHARYLADTYGFNVHSGTDKDPNKRNIKVRDEHGLILGRYMRFEDDMQHSEKYPGQMGGDYWSYSAFEAMCWNRIAGQRAQGGNTNGTANIGVYFQEVPKKLVLEFIDQNGKPLAGAEVWSYRAHGTGDGWYTKIYEDEPGLKLTADDKGRVTVDRTLWAADGKLVHGFGFANTVALLRVTYQGQHYYLFEEVTDANIAYNLGHKDEYVLRRQITLRDGEPDPKAWRINQHWDPPGEGFGQRPPTAGATSEPASAAAP